MAQDIIDENITSATTVTSGEVVVDTPCVYQIVNTLDVSYDYTIEATFEGDDFTNSVTVSSGTVNSASTSQVSLSDPWDKIRVSVQTTTAATSGKALVKQHS